MVSLGAIFVTCFWIAVDLFLLFTSEGRGIAAGISYSTGIPPLLLALGIIVFGCLMSWLAERESRRDRTV